MSLQGIYYRKKGFGYYLSPGSDSDGLGLPDSLTLLKVNQSRIYQTGLVLMSRDAKNPLLVPLLPGGGGFQFVAEIKSGFRIRLNIGVTGLYVELCSVVK